MRRLAFFPACILFISGLSWWSTHSDQALARDPVQRQEQRRELTEWLDRFVAYQHFYREAHGRFSRLITPVGLPVPPKLGDHYEIQVTDAGPDGLRVVARTDGFSRSPDQVTIDEGFNLRANFPIPGPRPGYLRYVALKTLRTILRGAGTETAEKTAFKRYFRYERRIDSRQRAVVAAIGEQEPVLGQMLELGPEGLAEGSEWAILNDAFGGGFLGQDSGFASEHLSRKVFQKELGRAPDSPEELALFAGLAPSPPSGLVTRDASPEPEIEALQTPVEAEDRKPASAVATASNTSKTQGNIRSPGLEIESVPEDN